jgi:hypothetical protein
MPESSIALVALTKHTQLYNVLFLNSVVLQPERNTTITCNYNSTPCPYDTLYILKTFVLS